MKAVYKCIIFILICINFVSNQAQTIKSSTTNANADKKKFESPINFNLKMGGCNTNNPLLMKKQDILQQLKAPLCAIESASKKPAQIISYELYYCERTIAEDSTGAPMIATDVYDESVKGDAIPAKWQKNLVERLYKGDTLRLENVRIKYNNKNYVAKEKIVVAVKE